MRAIFSLVGLLGMLGLTTSNVCFRAASWAEWNARFNFIFIFKIFVFNFIFAYFFFRSLQFSNYCIQVNIFLFQKQIGQRILFCIQTDTFSPSTPCWFRPIVDVSSFCCRCRIWCKYWENYKTLMKFCDLVVKKRLS